MAQQCGRNVSALSQSSCSGAAEGMQVCVHTCGNSALQEPLNFDQLLVAQVILVEAIHRDGAHATPCNTRLDSKAFDLALCTVCTKSPTTSWS